MRQRNKLIAIIIALIFMVGCAGVQMSSQEKYYNALGVWYDCGMQFKRYYQVADPVLKQKWDEEFRPLLLKAKDVLNIWYVHLYDNESVTNDMEAWKDMKNDLLFYIATQMQGKGAA